jgi:hypothetical protein
MTSVPTQSIKPDLRPVQRVIGQIVQYLNSTTGKDVSVSGLLNWFSMRTRNGGESVFDDDGLVKEDLRKVYVEQLKKAVDSIKGKDIGDAGRAMDGMIMSVANDIVAQLETVVNFRRLKVGHHFAKSRYNLEWLGKGAKDLKKSDSVLEEYTSVFLQNAIEYIDK